MISTTLNPPQECFEFSDSRLADNEYLFPLADHVEGDVCGPIERRGSQKLITNGKRPLYFLAEAILRFVYIKFDHQVNNSIKDADGL